MHYTAFLDSGPGGKLTFLELETPAGELLNPADLETADVAGAPMLRIGPAWVDRGRLIALQADGAELVEPAGTQPTPPARRPFGSRVSGP